ncbi:MAG: deoxyribodipyrimidine photo-lyase [Acholeplasmataceae bacterium]
MNTKRLTHLKDGDEQGDYVVYWMQQSQRIHDNHALNFACDIANKHSLPLVVFFSLYSEYPEANERSFTFMLEGMQDVKTWLLSRGVNFVLRIGLGHEVIFDYLDYAYALVLDYGYLKHQKAWRTYVKEEAMQRKLHCSIDMIDTDVLVPVDVVSDKREYGAYTIRPKIHRMMNDYLDMDALPILANQTSLGFVSDDDLNNINLLLGKLNIDQMVTKSRFYKGGYIEASHHFSNFLYHDLKSYKDRNDPSEPKVSLMSMYLHFGQISVRELLERMTLANLQDQIDQASIDAFVEQLIVRRELAFNYVTYNPGYDTFEKMTQPWAYRTMDIHEDDMRPYTYSIYDYETFSTHDEAFNAAMIEMIVTGYMHNYMRMYWAKKIIEWTPSFKEAYETILFLNNKYFIDGRDPNSYAGVSWCFGNHDRPWNERNIFGQLRYMNFEGLKRKFNILAYIDKMRNLVK